MPNYFIAVHIHIINIFGHIQLKFLHFVSFEKTQFLELMLLHIFFFFFFSTCMMIHTNFRSFRSFAKKNQVKRFLEYPQSPSLCTSWVCDELELELELESMEVFFSLSRFCLVSNGQNYVLIMMEDGKQNTSAKC